MHSGRVFRFGRRVNDSLRPTDKILPRIMTNNLRFSHQEASASGRLVVGKHVAGRPRSSDVDGRDSRLLDVAECLFLQFGYHNVAIEEIARAARVAARTIYTRFGGKPGLLEAAIGREVASQNAQLRALSSELDGDDAVFVALALLLLEGSLSQKALLLFSDSVAKRDFDSGRRLHQITRGAWRDRLLKALSSETWRVRCEAKLPVEIMADLFTGQIMASQQAVLCADPRIQLSDETLQGLAEDATRRFTRAMTGDY